MVETTQEKKTFKWGDKEYLLDDLLSLHSEQEQNYYNFARDRGKYNDEALAGLRTAIASRLDAAKNGRSFMADGSLDDDAVSNVFIPDEKKRKAKKGVGVNQDNTEWSKYYFSQLVKQLNPYTRDASKDTGSWDMTKHGLGAYLTDGLKVRAKDVFENYDKRDESNPDASRSFAERDAKLRNYLGSYKTWLEGKNFDFTKNDNEWDDNFMTTLNNVINNNDWSDRTALAESLRKLGADDTYATAFTSDRWDLSKSDSELEADKKANEIKQKQQNQVKAYNDAVTGYYNTYSALNPQLGQMTAYLGQANSNFYRTPEEILEWSRNVKGVNINDYQKRYDSNKWDVEAAQYILPLLQSNGRLKETTIDGSKYIYDPQTIDRTNHTFIAVDPVTGKMEQRFLYDIEEEKTQLRNKYLQAQGASKYHINPESHKEGGLLHMQSGGAFNAMEYLQSLDAADYKNRAKEKNVDEKVLREAERKPFGEDTLIDNTKFTVNDIVQLGTMAANIGTIFMDPISGGAAGAGLSTVDFINDISRDGFQGKDAINYIKNLGMDAIGMLPVIGDSFGTLGKVKKGLFQLAPKIIGYLGMAQGIANSPQIIDSFKKIVDDREMTTADWQNIASGINLIVSGSRAGKHAVKNSRAKKASIDTNKLQMEVIDKNGNVKLLVLDGDNAKAVKNSDHSVEAVNKIIHDIDGMQGYDVTSKSSVFDFSVRMPGRKTKNASTGEESRVWSPFESKSKKAAISEFYDPVKYARAYNSGKASRWAALAPVRNRHNVVDASGKENLEAFKAREQAATDTYIADLKARAKAYQEAKTANDRELRSVEAGLKRTNKIEESYNAQEATNNTAIANNQALLSEITVIKNARAKLKTLQSELDALKAHASHANQAEIQNKVIEIKNTRDAIAASQNKINDLKAASGSGSTTVAQAALDNATTANQALSIQRTKLQDLLSRLGTRKTTLASSYTTNSPEFEALINFTPREVSFNGKPYKFGSETAFTREALINEGMYKEGGSINKNKINKFLTYAKG